MATQYTKQQQEFIDSFVSYCRAAWPFDMLVASAIRRAMSAVKERAELAERNDEKEIFATIIGGCIFDFLHTMAEEVLNAYESRTPLRMSSGTPQPIVLHVVALLQGEHAIDGLRRHWINPKQHDKPVIASNVVYLSRFPQSRGVQQPTGPGAA